jgi:hypothetical protein
VKKQKSWIIQHSYTRAGLADLNQFFNVRPVFMIEFRGAHAATPINGRVA